MRTRYREVAFALAVFMFIFVSVILYNSIESRAQDRRVVLEHETGELAGLNMRLDVLEDELETNLRMMSAIRDNIRKERMEVLAFKDKDIRKENFEYNGKDYIGVLQKPKKLEQEQLNVAKQAKMFVDEKLIVGPISTNNFNRKIGGKGAVVHNFLKRTSNESNNMCVAREKLSQTDSDVQMLDVYEILPFDDPDGGVWKQGFDIEYDALEVGQQRKLEVIVVPHSHTDPGWIITFEKYYEQKTKEIFESMLSFLEKNPTMRFIYAEMSFFELWWAEIDEKTRSRVRKLLNEERLEIVTGAWVMTDEANSHYFNMISQMIEGHEWIQNHVGENYKPINHWSIDPFGLSPVMAFLLNRANITNGITQRIHYSVKKHLAQKKNLEFIWRQLWSGKSDKMDFQMHVMPFFSYDIPHTCGPDPKICCQFDFIRTDCPWGIQPSVVNNENVAKSASLLYDQYRKKAQLFKTNVLFVPLGDDFRYTSVMEWENQFANYDKLFKYMNSRADWNVNARFGTVNEYFKLMHAQLNLENEKLSVLSGDFFTYSDRNDHYWSGYYTSRPFYKQMDRTLNHYLRSSEILFSAMKMNKTDEAKLKPLFALLVEARRHMSVFQHHDGVTGTATKSVVVDYGNKLLKALKNCEKIIAATAKVLLNNSPSETLDEPNFLLNEVREDQNVLPIKVTISSDNQVLLFNSLAQQRNEVVCIYVDRSEMKIISADLEEHIMQQIGPLIDFRLNPVVKKNTFELCFLATVPALGFKKYSLSISQGSAPKAIIKTNAKILESIFKVLPAPQVDFELKNEYISAKFDAKCGLLMSLKPNVSSVVQTSVSFVHYGARSHSPIKLKGGDDLSGAYLFLPDGAAKDLELDCVYAIVEGPVMKKVVLMNNRTIHLQQISTLFEKNSHIELQNRVNIEKSENFELAMRLKTSVRNGDEFFTDLNGFQMIKRKRFAKLPLQAHFYPMPTAAYIEDDFNRVSVLSAQSLGVGSLENGLLEVMLDRRLFQDDGRGLGEGVLDNKWTTSTFRILVEPIHSDGVAFDRTAKIGFHSLNSHYSSLTLNYPLMVLHGKSSRDVLDSWSMFHSALPCDMHLVTLRVMAAPTVYNSAGVRNHTPASSQTLIVHRMGVDCRPSSQLKMNCTNSDQFSMRSLFKVVPKEIFETSLTSLYVGDKIISDVSLEPMHLRTFKLNF